MNGRIVADGRTNFLVGNPALEAFDLQDIGARDLTPTLGSAITWDDVDYLAEREAARPAGYVDAMCLGCGCALYVPAHERCGDVLCPRCQRLGEELADDTDPTPPAPAAVHPDYLHYVEQVKTWSDNNLVTSIDLIDSGRAGPAWGDAGQREAWIAAASAEVVRRLEARGIDLAA